MLFMQFPVRLALSVSVFALLAVTLPAFGQNGSSGVDLNAIDKSVEPCTDFYRYACGMWMKNNPRPSDQSRWGRFNELSLKNQEVEKKILEDAAQPSANRTPIE